MCLFVMLLEEVIKAVRKYRSSGLPLEALALMVEVEIKLNELKELKAG